MVFLLIPQNEVFEVDTYLTVTDISIFTGQAAVVTECIAIAGIPIIFALSSPMGIWEKTVS